MLSPGERPAIWRSICFFIGVVSIYFSLQSRVDFYAQHMFFIHRAQHFVLHHLGAFFVALEFRGTRAAGGECRISSSPSSNPHPCSAWLISFSIR